ncbi:sterol desaturase family protein [Aquibaculum arenosum]|uniref:Sterol desaturase family protein n=1 Tax=Aquibaculum arenosum TaxID=3032591 RepID=A0ABT5YI80_9PROT|nr:sterol desaturase family protein [Fodinicurvata sp. CAU 1616]MDF2094650.1 sterol desaturase family protein [Fodinicurvata sp. CAU 1616]
MSPAIGPWSGRKYFLDKMTLRDLVIAYFTYYAILVYLLLAAGAIALTLYWAEGWIGPALAAGIVLPLYPAVWYGLHRWVLHGQWLYRMPWTAKVWKRIHYDHHQDPHDLSVLFGALYTTLPTILIVTVPLGWVIAGSAGAAAATAAGLLTTCFYEFCHCIQHLPFKPKWNWLKQMKRLHLAHHFHSEKGNFGITNFLWDRLLNTYYGHPRDVPRSETVFNLGYTAEKAEHYPWVEALSDAAHQQTGALRPARSR